MPLPSDCSGLPVAFQHWHSCWLNCSWPLSTSTDPDVVRLSPLRLENGMREPQAREYLASGVKYTICEAPWTRKKYLMRYMAPMKPECIPAVALPLERCVYCWYVLHPTLTYPVFWSSTCCSTPRDWVLARYARIRTKRSSKRVGSSVSYSVAPLKGEAHS
jgi:hypothetical protein